MSSATLSLSPDETSFVPRTERALLSPTRLLSLCFRTLATMSWQLAYAVLSGLLVLLNSVPLYWQFVQGNSGAIAMGVWVVLTNLIEFVRLSPPHLLFATLTLGLDRSMRCSGITTTSTELPSGATSGSRYATFSLPCSQPAHELIPNVHLQLAIGQEVGRVAAVFCIARFLADIVSPRATAITRKDRRRRAVQDYLLSFGVPGVIMACHILYQPNRYRLVRGRGCQVTQVMTWPTLVLRIIWSPLFAVGGTLYSGTSAFSTSAQSSLR